jgi:hypothetical protein
MNDVKFTFEDLTEILVKFNFIAEKCVMMSSGRKERRPFAFPSD